MISTGINPMGHEPLAKDDERIANFDKQSDRTKTLRPALGGQILPALLFAVKPRPELLDGNKVFSFQRPRCFIHDRIPSPCVRLNNIDIHKNFCGSEAVMYKKTSNISIFSCITKP
jgi:hypothetical protein